MTPADRALARLLASQHGVASRAQAAATGVPLRTIDGRVQNGRYRAVLPGVVAEAAAPMSWQARALAAVLWAGGDASLARRSAARLWDLPTRAGPIHVVVRDRTFARVAGVVVHRSRSLTDDHVTERDGLPTTTPARTVVDRAGEVSPRDLRRLLAAAARDGLVEATDLRVVMAEVGRVGGIGRLRTLVDELSPLDGQCNSVLESDWLQLVRANGMPPTAMNHEIRDRHGGKRYLDAAYVPERLPIELDSSRFHSTTLDRHDDAAREALIVGSDGWRRPLRFTWGDVHERPGDVVARLRDRLDTLRAASGVRIAHHQ